MGPAGDGAGRGLISTLALKSLWKPHSFILCRWDLRKVYWILALFPSYHEFSRNASVSEILNIYFCNSENLSQVSWPQLWAFLLACDLLYFFSLVPCMRACVHAQSLQSCPTLCSFIDWSLPSSSVRGILQARILEWVDTPSPDLSNPGIEPTSPVFPLLQADSLLLSHQGNQKEVTLT